VQHKNCSLKEAVAAKIKNTNPAISDWAAANEAASQAQGNSSDAAKRRLYQKFLKDRARYINAAARDMGFKRIIMNFKRNKHKLLRHSV